MSFSPAALHTWSSLFLAKVPSSSSSSPTLALKSPAIITSFPHISSLSNIFPNSSKDDFSELFMYTVINSAFFPLPKFIFSITKPFSHSLTIIPFAILFRIPTIVPSFALPFFLTLIASFIFQSYSLLNLLYIAGSFFFSCHVSTATIMSKFFRKSQA